MKIKQAREYLVEKYGVDFKNDACLYATLKRYNLLAPSQGNRGSKREVPQASLDLLGVSRSDGLGVCRLAKKNGISYNKIYSSILKRRIFVRKEFGELKFLTKEDADGTIRFSQNS